MSRGLGDVYKRQAHGGLAVGHGGVDDVVDARGTVEHRVLGVLVEMDEGVRQTRSRSPAALVLQGAPVLAGGNDRTVISPEYRAPVRLCAPTGGPFGHAARREVPVRVSYR